MFLFISGHSFTISGDSFTFSLLFSSPIDFLRLCLLYSSAQESVYQ